MGARTVVLGIAGITALANAALGVGWPLVVTAGLSVVVVGEVSGVLLRRRPRGAAAPPAGAHPLSPRELEVSVLVATGLTSKEIGTKLGTTKGTVDKHLEHIYNKLGLDSRAQLAVWVVERGLLPAADARNLNTNTHK